MYERLIRDIKKALYKTLGRSTLVFSQLEPVAMDIERQLNNWPLTYVESDGGDGRVLTPNIVMWGENAHILEDTEADEDVLIRADKQLKLKRQHVWQRWRIDYIHSLMEQHRVNKKPADYPDVGEVLVVGDERNRAEWRKAKVVRHVRGRDGVVRGVVLLSKGHHIECPLSLVCPLEIRSSVGAGEDPQAVVEDVPRRAPSKRRIAKKAQRNIREQLSALEEL